MSLKLVRQYLLRTDVLFCTVDVLPDDSDVDSDFPSYEYGIHGHINMSMIVGPSAKRADDFKVRSANVSRSLLMSEILRFVSTVKTMYDL